MLKFARASRRICVDCQPSRMRFACALLVASLLVPATALAIAAKSPISGVYTTTLRGKAPPFLNGRWTISVAPSGRYGIYKSGVKLVTGSAKTVGTRVTFADQGGRAACHGSGAVGVYRWKLARGLLTLTPLSERCAGRKVVLSSLPLVRK
jgi:hypothetical protein